MANSEIKPITRAKKTKRENKTKKIEHNNKSRKRNRLFCNKLIEIMKKCPWFLTTEKQMQKRAKNKIQWNYLKQWNITTTKRICGVYALDNKLSD